MTICDDIREAQRRLSGLISEDSTDIVKSGNDKLSNILKPMADLEKSAINAIGRDADTAAIANKIHELGLAKQGGDISKSIGEKFVTALKGDVQVREAVSAMTNREYAELRDWTARMLGGEYGGDSAARTLEQTRKTMLFKQINELPNTPGGNLIRKQLDEGTMAQGFLGDGDIELLRIARTRMSDIERITTDELYETLDAGTKRLDTDEKIETVLYRMGKRNRENELIDALINSGDISQKSAIDARAKKAGKEIRATDVEKLVEEDKFRRTFYEENKLNTMPATEGGRIVEAMVNTIIDRGYKVANDEEILEIARNHVNDIDRVLNSEIYDALDGSTKQLNTIDKINRALRTVNKENTLMDDAVSLVERGNLPTRSMEQANTQIASKEISATDVERWKNEERFRETFYEENGIHGIPSTEGGRLVKNKLEKALERGYKTTEDDEIIEIARNHIEDIDRILSSEIYDSLDGSTKQLDTIDKINRALRTVNKENTLMDDAVSLVERGNLPTRSMEQANTQIASKEISATDVERWKNEERFRETFYEENGIHGIPSTEGGRLVKNKLDRISERGYKTTEDDEIIDVARNHIEDIDRILSSEIYDTLDGSTKQLDTVDKIKRGLSKISENDTLKDATRSLIQNERIPPRSLERAKEALISGKMNKTEVTGWKEEEDFINTFKGFTRGAERGTYDTIKRSMGKEVADELVRNTITDEVDDIIGELERKNAFDKIFKGERLNTNEQMLIDDIINGRDVSANDLSAIRNIADKISPSGWNIIMGPLRRFDTLDIQDVQRIMNDGRWRQRGRSTTNFIGLSPYKSATGVIKFVTLGLPTYYYIASFLQQQGYEAGFQFASFGREDDPAETLLSKYFGKDAIQAVVLESNEALTNFYEKMIGIPIYGEYFRLVTLPAYASNIEHEKDKDNIYNTLVERGLAKVDEKTLLGYSETTEEERIQIYRENENALFKNDAIWVLQYGEKVYGTKGFSALETPDKRAMNATQVAAYYHMIKGDGVVPYTTQAAMGLDERTKGWAESNPTFVQKVEAYGDNLIATKGKDGEIPSATGTISGGEVTATETGYYSSIPFSSAQSYQEQLNIINASKGKDGVPSFSKVKETDANANLTEFAGIAGNEGSIIKAYLTTNFDKATLQEINEAAGMNKSITAGAILESRGLNDAVAALEAKGMTKTDAYALLSNANNYEDKLSEERTIPPEILKMSLESSNPTTRATAIKRLEDNHRLAGFEDAVIIDYMAQELGFEAGSKEGSDYVLNVLKEEDRATYEATIKTYASLGWDGTIEGTESAKNFWNYVDNNYDAREMATGAMKETSSDSIVTLVQVLSESNINAANTTNDLAETVKKERKFDVIKLMEDAKAENVVPLYGANIETPEIVALFVSSGHASAKRDVEHMVDEYNNGTNTRLIETLDAVGKYGVSKVYGAVVNAIDVIPTTAIEAYTRHNDDYKNQTKESVSINAVYGTMNWVDGLGSEHKFDVVNGAGFVWNPALNDGKGGYDEGFEAEFSESANYKSGKWTFNREEYAKLLLSGELNGLTEEETMTKYDEIGVTDPYNELWWGCTGTLCGAVEEAGGADGGSSGGSGGGSGGSGGYSSGGSTEEEETTGVVYIECNVHEATLKNKETGKTIGGVNSSITLDKGSYTLVVSADKYVSREVLVEIGKYPVQKTVNLEKIPPSISTFIRGIGIENMTKEALYFIYCIYKSRVTSNYTWREMANAANITVPDSAIPTMISKNDVLYVYYIVNNELSSAQGLVDQGLVTLLDADGTTVDETTDILEMEPIIAGML